VLGLSGASLGLGGIAGRGRRGGALILTYLLLLEPPALAVELGDGRLGIGHAAMLALEIRLGLSETGVGFLLGLGHTLGLGGERIVRHAQALERCSRVGLVVAQ
jgi:hypothetical protein